MTYELSICSTSIPHASIIITTSHASCFIPDPINAITFAIYVIANLSMHPITTICDHAPSATPSTATTSPYG